VTPSPVRWAFDRGVGVRPPHECTALQLLQLHGTFVKPATGEGESCQAIHHLPLDPTDTTILEVLRRVGV
jgi:hypothetical protein